MKILLTGASGFLGSRVVEKLICSGHQVSILTRAGSDLWRIGALLDSVNIFTIDGEGLGNLPGNDRFDAIMHFATAYGRKKESPAQMIAANITFPTALLEYAAKTGVQRFINSDTSLPGYYNIYTATKKGFFEIMRYYCFDRNIKTVNLAFEYMYGPRDDLNKFIPSLIESIVSGKPIPATPGEQRRDFLFVDDAATACLRALESIDGLKEHFSSYAIGTGLGTSLKEFGQVLSGVVGSKDVVRWGDLPYRKNELFNIVANVEMAKKELGWSSVTPLNEGVGVTIEWHRKKMKNMNMPQGEN